MGNEVSLDIDWIDMETTGLDARLDVPLEVGLMITDRWGYPKASAEWLIWEKNDDYKRSMDRAMKNEFVREMHEKSGLFDELRSADSKTFTRHEAQEGMIQFLTEFGGLDLPLAGSSIGSLDRPFCLEHFPEFNKAISYRQIDVSSFKETCKRVNPGLWENIQPIIGSKEDSKHRVLDDIEASILEYRAYLENFFFTEDD